MGKFKHIWNKNEDGEWKSERSFIRYAVISTCIAIIFMCFIKHDNIFRWISAGITIIQQENRIEYLQQENERLEKKLNTLTSDRDTLEKFARENFLFAIPGEDVYIVE